MKQAKETIPDTLKLNVLTKAHTLEFKEIPMPHLAEDEVLLKQETCNICTTDYGQWLGKREHQGYPMAGGHEASGIIVAKGEKVDNELQIGDRVAFTYSFCGQCQPCRLGHTIECRAREHLIGYPYQTDLGGGNKFYGTFGFATYFARKARYLMKMSPDLDPAEAGFLEPVATVINGIKKLRVVPMETVVVIGAGTMGILNAQVARAFGARVFVSEILEKKLDCARKMGFETIDAQNEDPVAAVQSLTDGRGADAVIVAIGATLANQQAIEMVKQLDGRILFFAAGFPAPKLEIDSNLLHYRKLELIGAFEADQRDFFDASRLLNQRQIQVKELIEARFPLKEIENAYEYAARPGMYRVAVML